MVIVSKWSMLDVFIVAILVAWVKIDMVANVITHAGLNYFIISVVALSLIKNYVHWRLKKSLLQINKS